MMSGCKEISNPGIRRSVMIYVFVFICATMLFFLTFCASLEIGRTFFGFSNDQCQSSIMTESMEKDTLLVFRLINLSSAEYYICCALIDYAYEWLATYSGIF